LRSLSSKNTENRITEATAIFVVGYFLALSTLGWMCIVPQEKVLPKKTQILNKDNFRPARRSGFSGTLSGFEDSPSLALAPQTRLTAYSLLCK
jgi:hypothetical protein